nr:uracil-DNA glycosylase family protein [Lewinella sp. W8]
MEILHRIRDCTICRDHLPHGVNPVLAAHPESRVAIIGQAPGSIVHRTGIPWDDKSGDRLREWLGVSVEEFYDARNFAIIPMGFCYPGKGKSGDLPPRPECAPQWHGILLEQLTNLGLTLLIGQYAQARYLGERRKRTLTETVRSWKEYLPDKLLVLPHPSPRNNIWLRKNPWFEAEVLPELRNIVQRG